MTEQRYTVRTVRGAVDLAPSDGYVLPHEHLLADLSPRWHGPGDGRLIETGAPRLTLETLDALRHNPQGLLRENLALSDWYVAAREAKMAAETGCAVIVDLTCEALSPQARLCRTVGERAGVHVVAGVGRYMASCLEPGELAEETASLVDRWSAEIEDGREGCPVGVIGELGVGHDFGEPERRTLAAGAEVQARYGLPMNVHLEPGSDRLAQALDVLDRAGADLSRVAISHLDARLDDEAIGLALRAGCLVEFDLFGRAPVFRFGGRYMVDDEARVAKIVELADAGHLDRILVSHDICMRHSLNHYGGYGYAHLAKHVYPAIAEQLGEPALRTISRVNPLRFLHTP